MFSFQRKAFYCFKSCLLISLFFVSPFAIAAIGSATSNLGVSATVISNCIISTTAVAFGNYDPVGQNATNPLNEPANTGTVTITCTQGTTPTIGLNTGSNAQGSTRRMTDGNSDYLTYELYQPSTNVPLATCTYPGTTVWGNTGANLFTPAKTPSKAARTYNVCGTVAAGQDIPVGTYNDTVVATVNF